MWRGWINHVDLTVSDLEVAVPFYEALLSFLGFRRRDPAAGGPPLWHASDERLQLFGIALREAHPEHRGKRHERFAPGLHHLAFHAASREDVDELHRLLQQIGATILDAPADYPQYGPVYYALFFADPDGLKLEFVHMT